MYKYVYMKLIFFAGHSVNVDYGNYNRTFSEVLLGEL